MGFGGYSDNQAARIGNATHDDTVKAWIAGRDLKGSRIFCERGTIYSYGRHFPMAKLFTGPDGVRRALVTTERYSVTTSGHMSKVRVALSRAGIPALMSPGMRLDDTGAERRLEALELARNAIAAIHAARLKTDLGALHEALGLMRAAAGHLELADSRPAEFAELEADFAGKVAAWEARAARVFGKRTGGAWARIFALEGATGQFISAGAYMVPGYDGKLERRLCAYWRASDGRFCRIVKAYGEPDGLKVTWLDALPADLAKGV